MDPINDGGPAFPIAHHLAGCSTDKFCVNACPVASLSGPVTGMSLRDWFAGQALAGFMADPAVTFRKDREILDADSIARIVGIMADAMLAERAKRKGE